jgi:hypothetical protein
MIKNKKQGVSPFKYYNGVCIKCGAQRPVGVASHCACEVSKADREAYIAQLEDERNKPISTPYFNGRCMFCGVLEHSKSRHEESCIHRTAKRWQYDEAVKSYTKDVGKFYDANGNCVVCGNKQCFCLTTMYARDQALDKGKNQLESLSETLNESMKESCVKTQGVAWIEGRLDEQDERLDEIFKKLEVLTELTKKTQGLESTTTAIFGAKAAPPAEEVCWIEPIRSDLIAKAENLTSSLNSLDALGKEVGNLLHLKQVSQDTVSTKLSGMMDLIGHMKTDINSMFNKMSTKPAKKQVELDRDPSVGAMYLSSNLGDNAAGILSLLKTNVKAADIKATLLADIKKNREGLSTNVKHLDMDELKRLKDRFEKFITDASSEAKDLCDEGSPEDSAVLDALDTSLKKRLDPEKTAKQQAIETLESQVIAKIAKLESRSESECEADVLAAKIGAAMIQNDCGGIRGEDSQLDAYLKDREEERKILKGGKPPVFKRRVS